MEIKAFDYNRQLQTIREKTLRSITEVLDSGKLILGNNVTGFEKEFSEFIGKKYGIGVNSGTDAIKIALKSLKIGPGDEVITVSNSAVPTVSAIREVGATPVFVDVKSDFTINETLLQKSITAKTKIIMPVHLYGKSCNMDEIMNIARKNKIIVVEDCAQSGGGSFKEKITGSFGLISCFSFYPTKNLGAYGDAGIILTSNKAIADSCRELRMYGMKKSYYSSQEGYNSRLSELQAAILRIKLPYLNEWNSQRRKIAEKYLSQIINPEIFLPEVYLIADHCFHQFVIRVKNRKRFLRYLNNCHVGFGIHYPYPIHLQSAYLFLGYHKNDFPQTEKFAKQIVSLPIFPELTQTEIKYIINSLNNYKG